MDEKPKPKKMKLVKPSYQPSKAELEADLRVDTTFDQAVEALTKLVEIEYVDKPNEC